MGRDAGTDTIAAVVREATSADARGIAEVHVRCWQAAYGGILPRQMLDDLSVDLRSDFWGAELSDENSGARTLVAEDPPDAIAGFITVVLPSRDNDAGEHTAEIAATYVDPSRWNAGVGRSLLREALAGLDDKQWAVATLWIFQRNAQGRAFYARSGFRLDGTLSKHDASGVTTARMRVPLGPH